MNRCISAAYLISGPDRKTGECGFIAGTVKVDIDSKPS
jgi:hypothetical protein